MSLTKSEAARLNGAKSKGPVTAQGKLNSSRNAFRHGPCSKIFVVAHEDQAEFDELRDSYMDTWQPRNQFEAGLVETLASARWRLDRMAELEAEILDTEMGELTEKIEKEGWTVTEVGKLAYAFKSLADNSNSMALLLRYQTQYSRAFDKALKQLQDLKKQVLPTNPPSLCIRVHLRRFRAATARERCLPRCLYPPNPPQSSLEMPIK